MCRQRVYIFICECIFCAYLYVNAYRFAASTYITPVKAGVMDVPATNLYMYMYIYIYKSIYIHKDMDVYIYHSSSNNRAAYK